ncbi:MAG: glycosyltransferase, partial [Deltaproteobacteria bacterium]
TDGSAALIRRYPDPRIRRIENEKNLGVTRSLNLGLERARGRYVARMDADDLCSPERLEREVAVLDAHPRVGLVATRARVIDASGAEIGIIDTPSDGETLRRQLRRRNSIVHGSVLMRTEVVRALGGYDEAMEPAEDYDLWLRLSERHAIAALPDLLYAWREHDGGVGLRRLDQQRHAAERARLAARRRFASALVDEVTAGAVSADRAARRALELLWEEKTAFPAASRAAALARRVPRLYALRNLGPLLRLRQTLAACAAGGCDADATCAAVLTWMVALERGRRSA